MGASLVVDLERRGQWLTRHSATCPASACGPGRTSSAPASSASTAGTSSSLASARPSTSPLGPPPDLKFPPSYRTAANAAPQRVRPRKGLVPHPPPPSPPGRGGPRPGPPPPGRPEAREGPAGREHEGVQQRPLRAAHLCRHAGERHKVERRGVGAVHICLQIETIDQDTGCIKGASWVVNDVETLRKRTKP